jgi:D-alanyl-D-alanine carboxypeptidase
MSDSYLFGYPTTVVAKPIAPLYVNGIDVSNMTSLSCDWSGGGIVTTTDDLLLFQTALHDGMFGELMAQQAEFPNKFRKGIHYGFGMMELHFHEFFFLLKNMPRLKGHIGITSTHMFYDDRNDVHIIMNFGSEKRMAESFRTLIKIMQLLKMNR